MSIQPPVEQRWAQQMPDVPAALYPALSERCSEIERHAYNLGMGKLSGMVTSAEAIADLAAKFPELDPPALDRTWERGSFYAAR